MATFNIGADHRVQYHIKNWMTDTSRELLSIQNRILTSPKEEERSYLKSKHDTLSSVLQLLQGRKVIQGWGSLGLMHENAALRLKLSETGAQKQQLEEKLQVQTKINRDLKLFIEQSHRQRAEFQLDMEQKSQALSCELKEVQLKSKVKFNEVTAINIDLRNKLEEARKQLQALSTNSSADAPGEASLKRQGGDAGEGCAYQPEIPDKKDNQPIEDKEEPVVQLKDSELQELLRDAVAEVWDIQELKLTQQKREIASLRADVKLAEDSLEFLLKAERDHTKVVERLWSLRCEDLKIRIKELEQQKRPRRNN
ncbi:hypothetical protein GBF38_008801 [Nibea albiflora]|uniref:Uncharacterized protein n=1 Tax=Nibea albiflora TaxID=240163 RepID=A0ACB7ER56_NIBAL|nr:hypothetical protein GBF38_008801 [Nibea albiflora]